MFRNESFFLFLALVRFGSSEELEVNPSGYVDPEIQDPIGIVVEHIEAEAAFQRSQNRSLIDPIKFQACWKHSYGRGVGRPIHACPEGQDKDDGLCYKPCRSGYKGVGPVCWEHPCKPGYTDTGAFCTRNVKIISSNHKACPWYDVCGLTFSKGCSFCPEHDPPYKNDGCTCRVDVHTYAKKSYGRGVGKPMGCTKNEQYDAGLCYDYCRDGYYGVGPVCWQHCPSNRPHDSGAICCTTKDTCSDFIKDVSKASITAVAAAVQAGLMPWKVDDAILKALEAAGAFALLSCKRFMENL